MIDFENVPVEQLWRRMQEFDFRTNPLEAPLARAFLQRGFGVVEAPLMSEFTTTDWLACKVNVGGLAITFRQPTVHDLLVCQIERSAGFQGMRAAIFGLIHFFQFCHDVCTEIQVGGACISRWDFTGAPKKNELNVESLSRFYTEYIGELRVYDMLDLIWFFGDIQAQKRYDTIPIWKHCKRVGFRPGYK